MNDDDLDWDDDEPLCDKCGGLGEIECRCGGDLCVCENYGSIPCDCQF